MLFHVDLIKLFYKIKPNFFKKKYWFIKSIFKQSNLKFDIGILKSCLYKIKFMFLTIKSYKTLGISSNST